MPWLGPPTHVSVALQTESSHWLKLVAVLFAGPPPHEPPGQCDPMLQGAPAFAPAVQRVPNVPPQIPAVVLHARQQSPPPVHAVFAAHVAPAVQAVPGLVPPMHVPVGQTPLSHCPTAVQGRPLQVPLGQAESAVQGRPPLVPP